MTARWTLGWVLFLALGSQTPAQEPATPGSPDAVARRSTAALTEVLSLTDRQVPEVQALLLREAEKLHEVVDTFVMTDDPRGLARFGDSVRSILDDTDDRLAPMLTPGQVERLDAYQADRRRDWGAELWLRRYREPLTLAPGQEDMLRPDVGRHVEQMAALLSAGERANRRVGMRAETGARARIQELDRTLEGHLEAVLSADQLARFRDLRASTRTEVQGLGGRFGRRRARAR